MSPNAAAGFLAVVIIAMLTTGAGAAEPPGAPDTVYLPPADGSSLYVQYCAVCHGTEARGDGPLASSLTRKPANLRRLAVVNGGEFPADRVRASIDGRDLPLPHGTREMPIWGERFKRTRGAYGERRVQEHLDALVAYLRSLQE